MSNSEEKNLLLGEVDNVFEKSYQNKHLSYTLLFTVLLGICISLLVFFPKIYLRNSIYYLSRDISKIENEHELLREENAELKLKVEHLKFKNRVSDTIF